MIVSRLTRVPKFDFFFCRCLIPGKYSQHLERWLSFYPPQQLHIIDGEQLRLNPVEVMNDMQRFLKITPPFDYAKHLRYAPINLQWYFEP
jgi:heparan sulfate N-deacetylase/N-sulfotransferase NDST2